RVRAFVGEQTDAEFQQIPLATHVAQFRRMSADFGGAPVEAVRSASPTRVEVRVRGAGGPFTLELEVEPAPPHRISNLRVAMGGGGGGEPEPRPTSPLTDEARLALVDSAARLLARHYVTRDTAEMIGARLRERVRSGAYAGMTDRAALARALTDDIRAVHPDQHLLVTAGPQMQGPQRRAPRTDSAAGRFRFITDARVLDGNVGYLKMSSFPGPREAMDEMAAALRMLERTDAMIIDVRESRGGSAALANFLISHFTAPNLLSLAVFDPATGDTTLRRTLPEVPGPRRADVPLFVLIDRGSRSAAEDVPFVLRNLGRATLVGERTAGAGRNNRFFPMGEGMSISISVTRVWDPCTGAEWERTGITPDIAVAPADALDAALRAARDRRPAAAVPQAQCRG
ncbi:MAG TPA: S41 family peptidase, partial [Longimicrobium sp.]|nr:S41 family peptidase [Longimicrobium sp.]